MHPHRCATRVLQAVVLVTTLLLGACGNTEDAGEQVETTDPQSVEDRDAALPDGLATRIELPQASVTLDGAPAPDGASLRYEPVEGDRYVVETEMTIRGRTSIGPEVSVTTQVVHGEMEAEVLEVSDETFVVRQSMGTFEVVDADPPEMASMLESMFESLASLVVDVEFDRQGRAVVGTIVSWGGIDSEMGDEFDDLMTGFIEDSVTQNAELMLVLPDEAVAVGSTWTTESVNELGGFEVRVLRDLELVEHDGDRVTVAGTVRMPNDGPQELPNGSGTVEIESSEGEFSATLDLTWAVPVVWETSVTSRTVSHAEGMQIEMEMFMSMRMSAREDG